MQYPIFLLSFLLFWPAFTPVETMVENCANAIDDDQDGLIDLNDPDCECALLEPVSMIPNPSFEERDCCPTDRSQLGCASVWIQASEPTTDFIHDCGWGGWPNLVPPRPFPDGEGIMGFRDGRPAFGEETEPVPNFKEYAGACLLSPLVAGTTYRFEFDIGFVGDVNSPNIDVSFFGTTSCNNLPFGQDNSDLGCPTNGPNWVLLGSKWVTTVSNGGWKKAFIEVTPTQNITAIAIGPDCGRRPSSTEFYYFFDNLLLDDLEAFTFNISGTDHPCSPDFRLQAPNRGDITYQWYREGIALVGETTFRLGQNYGAGTYQVVIDDGVSCRRSDDYRYRIPLVFSYPERTLCPGESFRLGDREISASGSYVDTLTSTFGCDSIVSLELTVLDERRGSVTASIFPGETFALDRHSLRVAGSYELPLVTALGCDSIVELSLNYYEIFTPSAFSPNEDGINDDFTILGNTDLVEVVDLRMYDRWGNFLASGKDWDGRRGSEPMAPGLYVYSAIIIMDDGKERTINGSVMLLR
jgi:gliding motility-associated-like protein